MSLTGPYKKLDLLEHTGLDVSDLGLRTVCIYPVEFMNINMNTVTYLSVVCLSSDSDLPLSLTQVSEFHQFLKGALTKNSISYGILKFNFNHNENGTGC